MRAAASLRVLLRLIAPVKTRCPWQRSLGNEMHDAVVKVGLELRLRMPLANETQDDLDTVSSVLLDQHVHD